MFNGFIVTDALKNCRQYDGNSFKFGITVGEDRYLVKVRNESLDYLTEYIASRFIQEIGISSQEAWLGSYNGKQVVILKDFTVDGTKLRTFKDTRQSSEGTDLSNKTYTYADVLHLIAEHTKMSDARKQQAITQFWQMYICDAILGNRDRHHGNWGYITNGSVTICAPIYDNGACLFPDVNKKIHEFPENEAKFLFERSEKFPASLFMMERPDNSVKRTNYYEMFGDLRINRVLAREVRSLKQNIGYAGIRTAITKVVNELGDYLPDIYKKFYIEIVCMRYLHIIERKSLEASYKIIKRG